jgi:hypothetical protein
VLNKGYGIRQVRSPAALFIDPTFNHIFLVNCLLMAACLVFELSLVAPPRL